MKTYAMAVILVVVAGCATMQGTRKKYVETHPGITEDQRMAILKGDIVADMSEEMVRASWGPPLDVIREIIRGQGVISWIYQQSGDDHLNTYRVRFIDGRVREVRLINTQRRVYSVYRNRYWWRYYPEAP